MAFGITHTAVLTNWIEHIGQQTEGEGRPTIRIMHRPSEPFGPAMSMI